MGDPYLRRTLVRRRTACVRMLSSDKHSLTGERRIPKSATPSRRALTGGEHQLPLKFASPEQARDGGCVPPTSPRSSEDSLRLHAQLRQTFPHRRKMNTEERNSVEKPAHRRRAPAPVKVCFAGAGASEKSVPPPSPCSSEDSIRPRTQLRPTAGNRRTPDHRHHTSCQTAVMGGCHFQAAVLSVKGFVVGSGCGNKKANDNRMQILLVTIPFRRRRNYGI